MNKQIISLALFCTLAAPVVAKEAAVPTPDQPRFARIVVSIGDSSSSLSDLASAPSVAQEPLVTRAEKDRSPRETSVRTFDTGVHIFSAGTALLADLDSDGFAHRFRLSFDADTRPTYTAQVYAVISISLDGGRWNHFHTTDPFLLIGDRGDDKVDIVSELDDGYPPGYYDLLVEVYDADNDAFLADFGPYESEAMFALPLEDLYSDHYYDYASPYTGYSTDIYVESYGGGASDLMFIALLALGTLAGAKSGPSYLARGKVESPPAIK